MKLVTVTEVIIFLKFNRSDKYKTRTMWIPSKNSKMYLNICFAPPVSVEEQEVLALEYND